MPTPRQLPAALATFVGRDTQLRELDTVLGRVLSEMERLHEPRHANMARSARADAYHRQLPAERALVTEGAS